MSTNILPFRRDLTATLASLVNLNSKMSAQELFDRHSQILKLRDEGYNLMRVCLAKVGEIEPITNAATSFHILARRSGISEKVIQDFNSERLDWKAFEAERASLPRCRRL